MQTLQLYKILYHPGFRSDPTNPTEPNPTQPNLWMDPTHVQISLIEQYSKVHYSELELIWFKPRYTGSLNHFVTGCS